MKKRSVLIGLLILIGIISGVILFLIRDYSFSFVKDEKYGLSVKVNKYLGHDSAIVLPTKIGFWNVVEYDEDFLNNERIKCVTIPEDIITYPRFQENSYIQVVFFDNNCTYIPDSFFEDCINLRDVVGMSKVEKIGKNAFRGCKKLENIGRVSKEIIVGEGAFDGTKINIDEIRY